MVGAQKFFAKATLEVDDHTAVISVDRDSVRVDDLYFNLFGIRAFDVEVGRLHDFFDSHLQAPSSTRLAFGISARHPSHQIRPSPSRLA